MLRRRDAFRILHLCKMRWGHIMKHPVIFGCLTAVYAVSAAATLAYGADPASNIRTKTPIKHLVVIFQENISFDHYFGTYPVAANTDGTTFYASPDTPTSINTLTNPLNPSNNFAPLGIDLTMSNPNNNMNAPTGPTGGTGKTNGAGAALPFRLTPSQALTADQGHNDMPEQGAYDNGLMDGFPFYVGTAGPPPLPNSYPYNTKGLTMGYFDGNTVTAMWNYAQFYALNDNHYTTIFGPSTPGALNVIAAQTNGVSATLNVFSTTTPITLLHTTHEAWGDAAHIQSNISVIGDGDPLQDVCSSPTGDQVTLASKNIGDLLNAKNITWGAFMGGFDLKIKNPNGTTGCSRETPAQAPGTPQSISTDYIPHHAWFQYFASTRNPTHARPASLALIGHGTGSGFQDAANHNSDILDFFAALKAGNFPAVNFLKAPAYQDGHAGYSDPLDEQTFLVNTINTLQQSPFWNDTAVVITYDDSDGWYDHQMPPIVNPSSNPAVDILNGTACNSSSGNQQGAGPTPATPLNGAFSPQMWGRCGYGTRVPLLVISPYARQNYVDHTLVDQSSVVKFIEDNWLNGERLQPGASFDTIAGTIENMFDFTSIRPGGAVLPLNPTTGAPLE
jgi:phospholipase C